MKKLPAITALLLATSAFAGDAPPVAVDGKFAFDWIHVEKSKCRKIEGALQAKLRNDFTCAPRGKDEGSSSGRPILAACKAKKGSTEYLVFETAADCNEERETMLANAP